MHLATIRGLLQRGTGYGAGGWYCGAGVRPLRGAGLWLSRLISRRAGYAGVFALLFALAWLPVCGVLAASGYSFFWDVDGLSQQYVWFVYTGQWLRGVFSSLLSGDGLQVPLWTMDSGFGVDTVQSLVCTVVNPFYAVSALVPEQWAEQAFEASLVLQAYCAGLAFSLWSVGHGERRATTMVGALAYVFAGNMTAIFLQPGFLFPALAFPLALYGADRVFDRRSPLPFVAVMAWVFAFSFYDAYMICVMLVLYCLAMFFWKVERGVRGRLRWVRLARWVAVFVGYVLLSAAVAAVLFLPQAMAVLGQERLEVHRAEQVLYAPTYYIKLIMGFTSFSFAGGDAYTGWSPLAVPVLLLLLMRRRRQPALFWSFVVLTVMLCVPFFGSLMNAFQYPTARWAWAYSAFVSLAIARLLPGLLEARKREKAVIGAVCVVYVVCAAALPVSGVVRAEAVVMAAMVAVCFLGSALGYRRGRGTAGGAHGRRWQRLLLPVPPTDRLLCARRRALVNPRRARRGGCRREGGVAGRLRRRLSLRQDRRPGVRGELEPDHGDHGRELLQQHVQRRCRRAPEEPGKPRHPWGEPPLRQPGGAVVRPGPVGGALPLCVGRRGREAFSAVDGQRRAGTGMGRDAVRVFGRPAPGVCAILLHHEGRVSGTVLGRAPGGVAAGGGAQREAARPAGRRRPGGPRVRVPKRPVYRRGDGLRNGTAAGRA